MTTAGLLVVLGFLAALNQAAIEAFLGQWDKVWLNKLLPYVSLGMGLGEAFALYPKLDAFSLMGWADTAILGTVITGVVVGMGASAVHKFFPWPPTPPGPA
jgi:hypothetical protein